MSHRAFLHDWRRVIRGRRLKLALAGLGMLILSLVGFHVRAWLTQPFYRGRPASYWNRAFKEAFEQGRGQAPAYPHQGGWSTRLSVSLGLRHANKDLMELVDGHDPDAVPVLIGLLQDGDPNVRQYIAWRLGWMESTAKGAVPALVVASKDENAAVRTHAVEALGRIGPEAKEAVQDLIQALGDEDPEVRKEAIYALGQIGPEAREAVPILSKFLKSEESRFRDLAAYALGGIGPEAKTAVPSLLELLEDDSMNVRDSAYYALKKNDPQALAGAMQGKR